MMSTSHPLFPNGQENPVLEYVTTEMVAKYVGDSIKAVPEYEQIEEWNAWTWKNEKSA